MSRPLWELLVKKDWDLLQSIKPRNMYEWGKRRLKEDLVDRGPALIVMKAPCASYLTSASRIASFNRCGHLDYDDIRSCIQEAHQDLLLQTVDPEFATSASNHLDELARRALLEFASTQLLLRNDVVVCCPLSRPAAVGELLELADAYGVPLIVIECIALDKSSLTQWPIRGPNPKSESSSPAIPVDNDTNRVPWLVIDVNQNRYSAADDLREVVLQFILHYKRHLGSNCKGGTASSSHESGQEREKLKRHFSHSHPLAFVPAAELDNDMDTTADCRVCLLPIMGSSYNCPRCDFGAHQACIELPQYTSFALHIHPLSLYMFSSNSSESEESGDNKCIICNGAQRGPIYRCWQCYDVFVHHKCAQLSHELKHPCHKHPLQLKTYDLFCSRNQFTCRACGEKGGKISYGCSACKLELHPACVLELPLEIDYKCAQLHSLVLSSPPRDNKYDEYFCDICEEPRHADYWIYYCQSCPFHAHFKCVNVEIPAQSRPKAKKSRDDDEYYDDEEEGEDGDSKDDTEEE